MTICHGIPWYRNGADDHCPFIIEGWWLFFYPLSYLTLTKKVIVTVPVDFYSYAPLWSVTPQVAFSMTHLFSFLPTYPSRDVTGAEIIW